MKRRTETVLVLTLLAGGTGYLQVGYSQNQEKLSEQYRLSYALGMGQADLMQRSGVKVDVAAYSQGLSDTLSGNEMQLSEQEARALRIRLRNGLKEQVASRQRKQTADNEAAGEGFRKANGAREGVVTLENGLQYKVLRPGAGKKPTLDDTVMVNYRGALVDGEVFATTYGRGSPTTVKLEKAIPGWRTALPLMPVGSKWEIVLPPELGYGDRQIGRNIGPGSTLVFELELLSVVAEAEKGGEEGARKVALNGDGTR